MQTTSAADDQQAADWLRLISQPEELLEELKPYLEPHGDPFPMLRHPLVYSVPHFPNCNGLINRLLLQKKAALEEARAEQNWQSYVYLHERPYRCNALAEIEPEMEHEPYWQLFGSVWMDTENPQQNWQLWQRLAQLPGRREARQLIMKKNEQDALAAMPDPITIYRGHVGSKRNIKDFSWTIDVDVARWFARRFGQNGTVLTGTIEKEKVIAYLTGRNEAEIMALPRDVKQITVL